MDLCDPNDKFLRALILYKLNSNEFREVYRLLEVGSFSCTDGLLELWDEAHYREKKSQIEKKLTPLIKYRIRQKFPPPSNILPGGKRPSAKLPSDAVNVLKAWLQKHAASPYPSKDDKDKLVELTNLSMYQVKTWFANARRRLRGKVKTNASKVQQKNGTTKANQGLSVLQNESMSRNDCMKRTKPILPKSNYISSNRSADYEGSTESVPFSINDCLNSTLPRSSCMRSNRSNVLPRNDCMRSTNSIHLSHDYMRSTSPDVSIPSTILSPDSSVQLNASRSLQALAGMCEDIQPHSAYQQQYNFQSPSNANLSDIDASISVQSSPMGSPVDRNCTKTKELTLWQPFKSTENLTVVGHSDNAIQRSQSRTQFSTSCNLLDNHRNIGQLRHVAYQPAPMYLPHLLQNVASVPSLPYSEHDQPRLFYLPASFPNWYHFTLPLHQPPDSNPVTLPLPLPANSASIPPQGLYHEHFYNGVQVETTQHLA